MCPRGFDLAGRGTDHRARRDSHQNPHFLAQALLGLLAPTSVEEMEVAVGRCGAGDPPVSTADEERSRPTVVRLINDGVLPAERIGTGIDCYSTMFAHRGRTRQYKALEATAIDVDSDDDLKQI